MEKRPDIPANSGVIAIANHLKSISGGNVLDVTKNEGDLSKL